MESNLLSHAVLAKRVVLYITSSWEFKLFPSSKHPHNLQPKIKMLREKLGCLYRPQNSWSVVTIYFCCTIYKSHPYVNCP